VLEFTVSDTGIGISPDGLTRIFNIFEQETTEIVNQYGGSGLGLSISKSLVELMDGTISVRSETKTLTRLSTDADAMSDATWRRGRTTVIRRGGRHFFRCAGG
jgi:signal transduction histidine kinase